MSPTLEQFTGIPNALLRDPDAGFSLTHPIPVWAWALCVLAIGLGVWISYRGLDGNPIRRGVLAFVRIAILLLLLVMALGPRIEKERTRTERDCVYVLIDESRSMGTTDPVDPDQTGTGIPDSRNAEPRTDQLTRELALLASALERLALRADVEIIGFADDVRTIEDTEDSRSLRGERTLLGAAIDDALSRSGTRPVSSLLVLSDGRSEDAMNPETLERLRQSDVPVFTRAIGSSAPVRDLSIASVQSPSAVFADDVVPIDVTLNTRGYDTESPVFVELIDNETQDVLIRERAVPKNQNENTRSVTLRTRAPAEGNRALRVRVVSDSSVVDQIQRNNERTLELSVVSEPIRVLYIDGHPRWEYRYLKNTLVREPSIDATCTILARDRRFIVEGNTETARVPDTLEDWEPFDVVILGDFAPELLSDQQQRTLLEHVSERGCGVLMIAGPGAMPAQWNESVLSVLLPSSSANGMTPNTDEGVLTLTQAAVRAGVLVTRPGEQPPRISDPSAGWSLMRWNASVETSTIKPGVEVLAEYAIGDRSVGAAVTTLRYGAGRSGYVAIDETWRWRYGRGEGLHERFWLPIVRNLARGTIARRSAPARLVVSPGVPAPGERTSITLDVFDQGAIAALPESTIAQIRAPGLREPIETELRGSGDRRDTIWSPTTDGTHEILVSHPSLGIDPISAVFEVQRRDAETRDPSTDHASLRELSQLSGGSALSAQDLASFDRRAPNRTRVTALDPEVTPLWDTPLVLSVLIVLLSIEWIGRRIMRLA